MQSTEWHKHKSGEWHKVNEPVKNKNGQTWSEVRDELILRYLGSEGGPEEA